MRLLIITSRFPYPIEKGDKLRLYHQIVALSKRHRIILCSLNEGDVSPPHREAVARYCEEIHIFPLRKARILKSLVCHFPTRLPLQVAYFFNKKIQARIGDIARRTAPDHVYCHLIRCAEYARHLPYPKTIDYMDTFSVGMARRAAVSNALIRPLFRREARLLAAYEAAVFRDFEGHCIISVQDRELLDFEGKSRVRIVPNGVDTTFFSPRPDQLPSHDLVFVGNMGYSPNVNAALFIGKELLPLLLRRRPDIRILIAGARPSPEVRALASEHITVSGWVEDIRDSYAAGRVFVAPLFIGSGLQNKILEAMAMRKPCVTTPLVNNAIGAEAGSSILLADDAAAFAEQVLHLLDNADGRELIARNGHLFVKRRFGWAAGVEVLEEVFQNVGIGR